MDPPQRLLVMPVRPVRPDGWTADKRVTFCVTLAASGSVTFAAHSVDLSRKSAYALKKRDPTFAALWQKAVGAVRTARQGQGRKASPQRSEGDKIDKVDKLPFSQNQGDARSDLMRSVADAERDRFFAGLQMRLPAAMSPRRANRPLANDRKPSDGERSEVRVSAFMRLTRP